MRGSNLSAKVMRHINLKHKGFVTNVIVASQNGVPDLHACIDGKFYGFEIKGEGDRTRPLQDEKLTQIAEAGGYGGYVRSVEDVDRIVENKEHPFILRKGG